MPIKPQKKISAEQIDLILSFLPIFEQENFEASQVVAPDGQFPYHILSDAVRQFLQVFYDNDFLVSFDWSDWQDEARRYFAQPELLQTADVLILRKLLTLHIRKDRFLEGHLPTMIQCGHISAILRRLKALKEADLIRGDDFTPEK